ncbi:GntR family transcriptional regulator [Curtobacterium sp. NPDC090217]|uniref:GntR family transcriptional regulator n=1 Tax=unclassified Curtobacterium TaxID=257496 RepID=UPI0007D721BC|nr:GntR family transcriptional regulator [Curtobacterium sp. 9128]SBN63048.1 DNA-binding transcriptional regulator, GntR family [Curtobacterium sp. 9128]
MNSTATTQAASDRAYDHVKRAIIRGDLAGGTAISENAICQDLGISRTPVHEAFLRLAAEELIALESRKGAVVRPMSPNEAADVLEMREAIESTAATRVVSDGRVADLAPSLQAMLAEQEAAVRDGDVDRFIEVDAEFHGAVIGASRNAIAVLFARTLRDRQQRLRHQLMRVQPSQLQASLDDHRALARALEDGDAARYAEVLGAHVASHRGAL